MSTPHRVSPLVTYTRVTARNSGTRVVIQHTTVKVSVVAARGPEGPPGPAGPPGQDGQDGSVAATYTHTQSSGAATWTITHGLNRWPVHVSVVDSTDRKVEGFYMQRVDNNTVEVIFTSAWTGKALVS